MGTLAQIRSGLAVRGRTIASLHVYPAWLDAIVVPALLVRKAPGTKRTTFTARWSHAFVLTVAVQLGDLEQAQADLDEYTDVTGSRSLIAALEADETLGGAAEMILIGDWGEPVKKQFSGSEYLCQDLPVEVHTR